MKKATVKTDFTHTPDDALDNLAGAIYNSLNGNVNFTFTKTGFKLPDLLSAKDDYSAKLNKAKTGTKDDRAIKDAAKKTLVNLLHVMGQDVNFQANGDVPKLISSGFPLAGTGSKVHLGKPASLVVTKEKNSNVGTLRATITADRKASGYLLSYAEMPATTDYSTWLNQQSTKHIINVTTLTAGKQYKFVASYLGSDSDAVYSDEITAWAS